MDPITGNLTAQERAELKPGTVVVVRSGEHKTVRVYNAGPQMLVFEEGGFRLDDEFVRLASFTPAPAGECAECARLRGVVIKQEGELWKYDVAANRAKDNEIAALHEEGMATQARLTEALAECAQKDTSLAAAKAVIGDVQEQLQMERDARRAADQAVSTMHDRVVELLAGLAKERTAPPRPTPAELAIAALKEIAQGGAR